MQITLYNTCPVEYEKKFSKILKQVIRPALKEGRSVRVDEIKQIVEHSKICHRVNDKRTNWKIRIKKDCRTCPHRDFNKAYGNRETSSPTFDHGRDHSDLTMKIQII